LKTREGDKVTGWLLVQVGEHPSGRYGDGDVVQCFTTEQARARNLSANVRGRGNSLVESLDEYPFSPLERALCLVVPVIGPLDATTAAGASGGKASLDWRVHAKPAAVTEADFERRVLDRRVRVGDAAAVAVKVLTLGTRFVIEGGV